MRVSQFCLYVCLPRHGHILGDVNKATRHKAKAKTRLRLITICHLLNANHANDKDMQTKVIQLKCLHVTDFISVYVEH